MDSFATDIMKGLRAAPKYLPSKYFYDETGDKLFRRIMQSPEYYLTACEYEILSTQSSRIADCFFAQLPEFDLVELGAGDCSKSKFLLRELIRRGWSGTFFPVDISSHAIGWLRENLPGQVSGLRLEGLNGEYLPMLEKARRHSPGPKAVLFLGANAGNMEKRDTLVFLKNLRKLLRPGDLAFIGFDLKKDPHAILAAYHDKAGLTAAFNLNLLSRINRELQADFDTGKFTHFPVYDPLSGAARSYLVSLEEQSVRLEAVAQTVQFGRNEPVFMEISQKYSIGEVEGLAADTGFETVDQLYDRRGWFTDVVWRCPPR